MSDGRKKQGELRIRNFELRIMGCRMGGRKRGELRIMDFELRIMNCRMRGRNGVNQELGVLGDGPSSGDRRGEMTWGCNTRSGW